MLSQIEGGLPADAHPAPEVPAGGPEASGAPAGSASAALRIGLIALLVLGAGAFGLYEAGFVPRSGVRSAVFGRRPQSRESVAGDFPLLERDVALAREPVAINGRDVESLRCASELPPVELVEEYALRLRGLGYEQVKDPRVADAIGPGRFVRFHGSGQAMLGLKAPDGGFLGIIAFENPDTGGSDYFVVKEAPGGRQDDGMEAAGKGPPGVEPPPASEREYCVERKGRNPSYLVLYRSQAALDGIVGTYRLKMPEAGWSEPTGSTEAFDGVPGGAYMLFRRGNEQCLISVSPSDEDERECRVSVMYRRRPG